MNIEQLLALLTALLLTAALPLSLIAVRGFWHAPFGAVLRPGPVVLVCYIVVSAVPIVVSPLPRTVLVVVSLVGTLSAFTAAVEAIRLLTERRAI